MEMALEVAGDAKATAADKVLPLTLLWDLLEYTPLERCPAPASPHGHLMARRNGAALPCGACNANPVS